MVLGWVPFKIVSDSSALHSRWLLLLKIENSSIVRPEVNCHIFTPPPPENNRLLDYYKIISISRPILVRANMGFYFVSGQYGCLFSRCWKYVINSLIMGISILACLSSLDPYWPSTPSRANLGVSG